MVRVVANHASVEGGEVARDRRRAPRISRDVFQTAREVRNLHGVEARVGVRVLTAVYVLLDDRSRSMWPTFIVRALVDLQLVLPANLWILPHL
jgi:hypothetical protein